MNPSWLHDPTLVAAALASATPFVSFALILVLFRPNRRLAAGISIAAITVSLGSALFLLVRHWHLTEPIQYAGKWLISGDIFIPFGFLLDQLSLLMLTIVAVISFLVQV